MSSSGKIKIATPALKNALVVVVRTEWNASIVEELFAGCKKLLNAKKIKIREIIVPGAVEIPFAIKKCWEESKKPRPDAFIALGCVIKGDTPHFEYVCQSVTQGITTLNLQLPVATIFGILTVNTAAQAAERIGGKEGHKGTEAADAAIKMISISRSLQRSFIS